MFKKIFFFVITAGILLLSFTACHTPKSQALTATKTDTVAKKPKKVFNINDRPQSNRYKNGESSAEWHKTTRKSGAEKESEARMSNTASQNKKDSARHH